MLQKNGSCTILYFDVLLTPKIERLRKLSICLSVSDKDKIYNIDLVLNEMERTLYSTSYFERIFPRRKCEWRQ